MIVHTFLALHTHARKCLEKRKYIHFVRYTEILIKTIFIQIIINIIELHKLYRDVKSVLPGQVQGRIEKV